ncbi:Transcription factor lepE [Zalerion maritima]|uniref:Transcription factor lepE n=1 Tax=Zalerion maritima TaxID=339359 RepID=A0AAD5RYT8_9PEZI|nr:Transcription factor lepE [Zalerion maritima]
MTPNYLQRTLTDNPNSGLLGIQAEVHAGFYWAYLVHGDVADQRSLASPVADERDVSIVCTYQIFDRRPKRSSGSSQSGAGRNPRSEPEPPSGSCTSDPNPEVAKPRGVAGDAGSHRLDEGFPSRASGGVGVPVSFLASACAVASSSESTGPETTAGPESSATPNTTSSFTEPSPMYTSLVERVRQLESQLGEKLSLQDTRQAERAGTFPTVPAGKLRVSHNPSDPSPVRGVVSKTRLFGITHWMNGAELFPFVREMQHSASDDANEARRVMQQCKALGKVIKTQRSPFFTNITLGARMPARGIADKLVDAYLRTFDTVSRILHVPTFRKEYELYWTNPQLANQSFVVLLQLVMAIGATFYDERFTIRTEAVQWIQEARFWLSLPFEKQRLTIQGIQIMCLLHYARETCAVSGDLVWISAGSLIRYAMMMGLHRDPSKLGEMSVFRAEIRRRLWAVILEISLQSCIDAGGSPLIRTQDFDTKPPSNLNDEQLGDSKEMPPVDESEFTETSMLIAITRTFPTRLSVACYLSNISSVHTYDETLRLSSELTKVLRKMSLEIRSFYKSGGTRPGPTPFQISFADVMTHRFFLTLHLPVVIKHHRNPNYYFSRKLCVDTALKLFRLAVPATKDWERGPIPSAIAPSPIFPATAKYDPSTGDYPRLCTNGSGPFRSIIVQSTMTIRLELQAQIEEDDQVSLAPHTTQKQDLLSAMKSAGAWSLRRIQSGETNPKGHVSITTLATQVEFMAEKKASGVDVFGKEDEVEMEQVCERTSAESAELAFKELKEVAKRLGVDVGQHQLARPPRHGEGALGKHNGGLSSMEEKLPGVSEPALGNSEGPPPAGLTPIGAMAFEAWNDFDFVTQDDIFTTNFWQDLMPL